LFGQDKLVVKPGKTTCLVRENDLLGQEKFLVWQEKNNFHAKTPHILTKSLEIPVNTGEMNGEVFDEHLTKHLTKFLPMLPSFSTIL